MEYVKKSERIAFSHQVADLSGFPNIVIFLRKRDSEGTIYHRDRRSITEDIQGKEKE